VIADIEQLRRDLAAQHPKSRISQMMAALVTDAAHVRTELVSIEAGRVRPPKARSFFAALRRSPSPRDLR